MKPAIVQSHQTGSALTLAIIFTLILGFLMGSYLDTARLEMHNSTRTYMKQACVAITEAVAENGVNMILNGNTTGWTTSDTNADGDIDIAYRRMNQIGGWGIGWHDGKQYAYMNNGFYAEGFIFIEDIQNRPRMRIEGRMLDRQDNVSTIQIEMEIRRRSLFANGLTARDTLTFSGSNVYVDSYDSSLGAYSKPGNYNDKGSVGTISVVNDVLSPGNGEIFGSVGSGGGSINLGSSGKVYGWGWTGSGSDPDRISYDFFTTFEDISNPTLTAPITSIQSGGVDVFGTAGGGGGGGGSTVSIGDPSGATITYYELDALSISGGDTLSVVGPVVFVMNGDIKTSGTGLIDISPPNGSLEIYTEDNVDITGNGFVNSTSDPSKFLLYGTATSTGTQTIKVAGNGALHGAIYAPNASFTQKGGGSAGEIMGAVVANDITMTGNANFHYDERLADLGSPDDSFQLSNWFEITRSVDKLNFDQIESGAVAISSVSL